MQDLRIRTKIFLAMIAVLLVFALVMIAVYNGLVQKRVRCQSAWRPADPVPAPRSRTRTASGRARTPAQAVTMSSVENRCPLWS